WIEARTGHPVEALLVDSLLEQAAADPAPHIPKDADSLTGHEEPGTRPLVNRTQPYPGICASTSRPPSTAAMVRIQRFGLPRGTRSVLLFGRAFAGPTCRKLIHDCAPPADALVHCGGGRCCAGPGGL